ncbi:MAG: glycoside hydrolase family 3 C-terminal domain-containing protein [Bacteroidales bacterium]|nr:glycoside hydrolase family 3 C-terminal domain-containing protein [Bacteroidales bacterium]
MNKLLLSIVLLAAIMFNSCNQKPAENNTRIDPEIETNIKNLLAEMTLEEKIGQMTQLTYNAFMENGELSESKIQEYIVYNGIGSVLNVDSATFSLEKWHKVITSFQDAAKKSRLKIPVLYGIDAIHGANYTNNSTLFPHNIGLAATRNPELIYQSAKITAKEVRASGIRWNFDPVLGVGRTAWWPRFEETFGEDPYLVTQLGIEVIRGYEEDGLKSPAAVASCMKHYLGYSLPRSGKDRTPAYIPDVELQEYFLPSFKAAVEQGSSSLMVNSGSINGVPVHINKYLLTDLLKNELGFDGVVVTDWADIQYLYNQHFVAKDNKEAVKMAVNAGIDMSMVPLDLSFYNDLIALVSEGEVSMDRINDAVTRILRLKYRLGLFDNPYPEEDAAKNFGLDEYKLVALDAARESVVLLKNDTASGGKAFLPLNKGSKVLVAGPAANSLGALHGSWSYIWLGADNPWYPKTTKTIVEAIEDKIGKQNVLSNTQRGFIEVTEKDIFQLKSDAKGADVIVLCLGENAYAEVTGNVDELGLPYNQLQLAKAAIDTGKPVILVLTEGRPRIIREIVPGSRGILMAHRPASKGAEAIADVLFGDYNPNGRLAFTYPAYSGDVTTYDAPYRLAQNQKPQWPFGFGLSYTKFEFGNIVLSTDTLIANDILAVQMQVKNIGPIDGKIAIDLFTHDIVASIIPPQRRLRKFTKIGLKAGESALVEFTLTREDLAFVNSQLERVTEEGDFEVIIEDKTAGFYYKEK